MKPIYFDHNASTPLDSRVTQAMKDAMDHLWGNPSSSHWAGRPSKISVETSRLQVANFLGAKPQEVIFTSGGSEANNHALKGAFFAKRKLGNHIITSRVEHPAIIEPCRFLETQGAEVTYLPVDASGKVNPEHLLRAIRPTTILVSIMHANNEVGTIQPISDLARIARDAGALFHTDAAQSVGKIPTKVDELGVDMLTMAGHKFHAPKGVGALYVKEGIRLEPLIHGAGHEWGRRAGTENVILNVGLGTACSLADRWVEKMREVALLRDYFWDTLRNHFSDAVRFNGHTTDRLPNTLNLSFLNGQTGAEITRALPDLAASTGSACHDGEVTLSPVLAAMGLTPAEGRGAVRFSLGLGTTKQEIDLVVKELSRKVR